MCAQRVHSKKSPIINHAAQNAVLPSGFPETDKQNALSNIKGEFDSFKQEIMISHNEFKQDMITRQNKFEEKITACQNEFENKFFERLDKSSDEINKKLDILIGNNTAENGANYPSQNSWSRHQSKGKSLTPTFSCFKCGGPHFARECLGINSPIPKANKLVTTETVRPVPLQAVDSQESKDRKINDFYEPPSVQTGNSEEFRSNRNDKDFCEPPLVQASNSR